MWEIVHITDHLWHTTRDSLPSYYGDYTTFDGWKENVILLVSKNRNTS
jgi:hypothetical protein